MNPTKQQATSIRARNLFQFDGTTGDTNSIVDVPGVLVGHSNDPPDPNDTLQTGVTTILPQGYDPTRNPPKSGFVFDSFVPAAWLTHNGNGEMTGTHLIEELGLLEGPIMLTNTLAVGTVRDAVIKYGHLHTGHGSAQSRAYCGIGSPQVGHSASINPAIAAQLGY